MSDKLLFQPIIITEVKRARSVGKPKLISSETTYGKIIYRNPASIRDVTIEKDEYGGSVKIKSIRFNILSPSLTPFEKLVGNMRYRDFLLYFKDYHKDVIIIRNEI